jgi:hypothetical protein
MIVYCELEDRDTYFLCRVLAQTGSVRQYKYFAAVEPATENILAGFRHWLYQTYGYQRDGAVQFFVLTQVSY